MIFVIKLRMPKKAARCVSGVCNVWYVNVLVSGGNCNKQSCFASPLLLTLF